mgnify:CR=1 FL=1
MFLLHGAGDDFSAWITKAPIIRELSNDLDFIFKAIAAVVLYYGFAAGKNFNTAIWNSKYFNAWLIPELQRKESFNILHVGKVFFSLFHNITKYPIWCAIIMIFNLFTLNLERHLPGSKSVILTEKLLESVIKIPDCQNAFEKSLVSCLKIRMIT